MPEIRTICPVCEEECETYYMVGTEIIGCDGCISTVDAYDYEYEQWECAREARGERLYGQWRDGDI